MTDNPMTPERFATLADAYGGDLRRWPSNERPGAEALLSTASADARASLARAEALDGLLGRHWIPAPSSALIGRVLAAASTPGLLWSRARLWWSGLGLAGVGLVGAMTGALALSLATPMLLDHRLGGLDDGQTIFGEVDLDGMTQ